MNQMPKGIARRRRRAGQGWGPCGGRREGFGGGANGEEMGRGGELLAWDWRTGTREIGPKA